MQRVQTQICTIQRRQDSKLGQGMDFKCCAILQLLLFATASTADDRNRRKKDAEKRTQETQTEDQHREDLLPKEQREVLEEAFQKLHNRQLVTRVMEKPSDCTVFAEVGDEMHVHYTGYLANGELFDSSVKGGRDPISFRLGDGRVIAGWEQGLLGMCVGEQRRLIIPPELAYGASGFPPLIPGDATLMFETTLVNLKKRGHTGGLEGFTQLSQLGAFIITPVIIAYVFYYMYQRYQADSLAAKAKKNQGHGKKSRKRR